MYIIYEGRQSGMAEIRSLCDEVMRQDREYRQKEADMASSSGYKSSEGDTSTVLYFEEHVEKITKNAQSNDLTAEEKQHRVDQSFLLLENPIDVVVLDSLFNLALQQDNLINGRAALAYTVNGAETVYSNPDFTFYESACALSPIVTGVKDEIVLQAYVDIPLYYGIGRNKKHFIIIGVIFCLILGFLIVPKWSKKFVTPVCEEPRELIKIKENILFDRGKGILYLNVETQVSLENYKLKLFILLLDSPEHFQTIEEIKKAVWGKAGATNDTLNTTIKRLRANLKPISDLKIVYGNGGYRLEIL